MTVMAAAEQFGRVAVLMGGPSAERVISLESGTAVHAALLRQGVEAEAIDWRGGALATLEKGGFDRVFVALHGRGGEDGQIQGYLETLGLPYTGSGVLGSALAMDKVRTKRIWQAEGLPTPAFRELTATPDVSALVQELGLPLMVKPVREGSSLGASKVTTAGELLPAWQKAAALDARVMVERWITGGEYTAPLLGERALPLIKLETPRTFYDYEAKYHDDRTRYLCPCGLSPAREKTLQHLALQAFHAVDGRGWGRVDLLLDQADEAWLIEANTIPGMTSHSLVPMAARVAGMTFDDLVLSILHSTLRPHREGSVC